VKADVNRFVLRRDNEAVELLLNSDMEGSRLLSVDSDKEIAKKARGRPDISLWKVKDGERERLLVIECKFSDSPPYLTAGRFKAMAYLYEYGAQLGALYALFNVFPPLVNALWGLCVLGQSVVPMRRIMEMEVTGRQELKAMAR
jgi:hypothetical protein